MTISADVAEADREGYIRISGPACSFELLVKQEAEEIMDPLWGYYTLYINNNSFEQVADSYPNTLITYEKGAYTIHDIFNSGADFSFTLPAYAEIPEDSNYGKYAATPAGNNRSELSNGKYFYILDQDGNAAGATFYNLKGETYSFEEAYLPGLTFNSNQMSGYYYGDQYNDMGIATWAWMISFPFYSYDPEIFTYDGYSDWIWVNAYIPTVDIMTGVRPNKVETDSADPVYYNLQGVRVANPEKGLFIKVENGKTTKVIK